MSGTPTRDGVPVRETSAEYLAEYVRRLGSVFHAMLDMEDADVTLALLLADACLGQETRLALLHREGDLADVFVESARSILGPEWERCLRDAEREAGWGVLS